MSYRWQIVVRTELGFERLQKLSAMLQVLSEERRERTQTKKLTNNALNGKLGTTRKSKRK